MMDDFESIRDMDAQKQDDRLFDPREMTPEEDAECDLITDRLTAALLRSTNSLH